MGARYIIVGAGVAGATACKAVREIDPKGELRLFTEENYPFYSRMRLPEVVSGKSQPERLLIMGASWFQDSAVLFHPGEQVKQLSLEPLGVVSTKGEYRAERVLLATGGYGFMPPIPGADLQGVLCLRTMADAINIRDQASSASKALLIGGGVLGLELGNALRLRGLEVSVVEVFDRLLPRQTDPKAAEILKTAMEAMGFRFYLGVQPKEIQGKNGKAVALLLADGRSLEADLFLVSAGVRPRLELAKVSGIKTDKAILVNDKLETSVPNVYAAGDCVEHRGVYYGIWPAAEEQGRVAGINMAGGQASYAGTVMSNQLKVLGIDLLAAGQIDPDGLLDSEVVFDPERSIYRKLVYKEDKIVGAILLGDTSGHKKILEALEKGRSLGPLKGSVLEKLDSL